MSRTNGKRKRQRSNFVKLQTQRGMAKIRFDMEVFNSMLKRGLVRDSDKISRLNYVICGCGVAGCGFTSVQRHEGEQTGH